MCTPTAALIFTRPCLSMSVLSRAGDSTTTLLQAIKEAKLVSPVSRNKFSEMRS